jgi:thiol-disulfide isomerase/thioredoxin
MGDLQHVVSHRCGLAFGHNARPGHGDLAAASGDNMAILAAAVTVIGVLCLTDLLLTFGVIRRLRNHSELLAGYQAAESAIVGLRAGAIPEPFSAVTADGEAVNVSSGLRLAAFFSSSCSACPEQVPPFLQYVRENRLDKAAVLAVMIGRADQPARYLARLAGVAQVCLEAEQGPVAEAFQVTGFPAFFVLDGDGAVLGSGFDPSTLPALAAV